MTLETTTETPITFQRVIDSVLANPDTVAESLDKVRRLCVIQGHLNQKVNLYWRDAGYNWLDAIWQESAELFNHLNWKWWKTSKPVDMDQVKLEAIDILHFVLSESMIRARGIEILAGAFEALGLDSLAPADQRGTPDQSRVEDVVKNISATLAAHAAACRNDGYGPGADDLHYETCSMTVLLLAALELSLDSVFKMYVGKNALNRLRYENGYGSDYVKIWFGEEDNVWLARIMEQFDANDEYYIDKIYEALRDKYKEVMASTVTVH